MERDRFLSVIVPVFNEGAHIIERLDLLIDEIEENFKKFEIIVVSDGSTDQTNMQLISFRHPDVRVQFLLENRGKGHAVRAGLKRASGDYILFIDGGMELHPRAIRAFVVLMDLYECDVVMGSKRHPQSQVVYPWYRKFLSWVYQVLVRILFSLDVTDTQVGLKLFRRPVIVEVLPYLRIDRYGFDLELLSLAKALGYSKMLEAPVRLDYFAKQTRRPLRDLVHVLKIGLSLLVDTWRLYLRIRRLQKRQEQAVPIGD